MTTDSPELKALVAEQRTQITNLLAGVKAVTLALENANRRALVFPVSSHKADSQLMVRDQPCWLKSLVIINTGLILQYIHLFDSPSPVPDGRRPDIMMPVDSGAVSSLDYGDGLYFSKGLYIAWSGNIAELSRIPNGIESYLGYIHANIRYD